MRLGRPGQRGKGQTEHLLCLSHRICPGQAGTLLIAHWSSPRTKVKKLTFVPAASRAAALSFFVYGLFQAGAQLFVQQRRVAFLLPQGIAQGRQFRMAGSFPHDPGMAKRLFFQLDDTTGDQHFPYVEDIADIADASPGHHEPRFGPAHDAVARQADPGQGLIKAGLRGQAPAGACVPAANSCS